MLLGDVLPALRSSLTELKAVFLGVLELPLAALSLTLEVFDQVHDSTLGSVRTAEAQLHLPASSATAKDDAALAQVVGRQFHGYGVTGQDADVVLAHLAGDMGRHHMAISQFYPESRVGQGLGDLAFHLDRIFFGHGACIALRGARIGARSAP